MEMYATLSGGPLRNPQTQNLLQQSFWKDKSGCFCLPNTCLPLDLEHRSIFLGLLLNTGLLTGEKELVHLNHSSANRKAQGRMKYIQAQTTPPPTSKA